MSKGAYRFEGGTFVPDEGMKAIRSRVSEMSLLADSGEGRPSFYLDARDHTLWELREFPDYRTELREVDRTYITTNYPTVDVDRPL